MDQHFRNLWGVRSDEYAIERSFRRLNPAGSSDMNMLSRIPSWIALHWKTGAVIAGAIGIAATCRWCLETDEVRVPRVHGGRAKRKLAHSPIGFLSTGAKFISAIQPGT